MVLKFFQVFSDSVLLVLLQFPNFLFTDFTFESVDELVDLVVFFDVVFGGAADDQRGPSFVDEDAVDFIHDGKMEFALNIILEREFHVVSKVIESEFVIGAVGDVLEIGFATLAVVEAVLDQSDIESQEFIDLPHPAAIAFG